MASYYAASTPRIEKRSTRSFALLEELYRQLERNDQLKQQIRQMEEKAQVLFQNLTAE